MKNFIKLKEGKIIEILQTSKEVSEEYIEVDDKLIQEVELGGSYDEKSKSYTPPEKKEEKFVTNEQLDEKLDKIISLLQKKEEKE